MTAGETGIEVTTRRYFLSWILAGYPPTVEVDGQAEEFQWKQTRFLGLPTGEHELFVYFSYMFGTKCGKRRTTVVVEEGKTLKINYHAPVIVFMRGRIRKHYA